MTTKEVDDEKPQIIIKQEDEEIPEKQVQDMKPPSGTKVPKSSKALARKMKTNNPFTCVICHKTFKSSQPLRFHIRQAYFNLKAKKLLYEMKEINQVWVEKVLNSNELIQITKIGPNTLRMKKTAPDSVVENNNMEEIDMSYLYATNYNYQFKECPICDIEIPRKRYKKHLASHMI